MVTLHEDINDEPKKMINITNNRQKVITTHDLIPFGRELKKEDFDKYIPKKKKVEKKEEVEKVDKKTKDKV